MTTTIRISVRPLVEYVYRSGSIRPGFRTNASMQEGTRIHQRVQKEYTEEDLKEIVLEAEIQHGDLTYVVEGRCDGLIRLEGQLTVDEIKSTAGNLDDLGAGVSRALGAGHDVCLHVRRVQTNHVCKFS